MTNALAIRASVALIEAGFTREEVLELLVTQPGVPTPSPANINGPTRVWRVWDGADYWERDADTGLWSVGFDSIAYTDWSWERLTNEYTLWTDMYKATKVPKDAW